MKKLPELSENGQFILMVVLLTLGAIILIGEWTGLVDRFINSFN